MTITNKTLNIPTGEYLRKRTFETESILLELIWNIKTNKAVFGTMLINTNLATIQDAEEIISISQVFNEFEIQEFSLNKYEQDFIYIEWVGR